MPNVRVTGVVLVFLAQLAWAGQYDPCAASSSVSDIQFSIALKGSQTVFHEGEIIPLVLSFTSTTKDRYWAETRNYDRSGRLSIEYYCLEPEVPDPLASYFESGMFMGGGLGNEEVLGTTPFTAKAELNEWWRPVPGHYRVYAISQRVWRVRDPHEQTDDQRVGIAVRSNAVEFDVKPASAAWRTEQLSKAMQALANQLSSSPDEARHAARVLRFLNTKESTKQLARLFWGLNEQQPVGWDLMFGLYGSPYRQFAIDSMHAELAVPDHAITSEFLQTLVGLQVSTDSAWRIPSNGLSQKEEAQAFWQRKQAHTRELMKAEMQSVVAALPRKTGKARALTLNGLLLNSDDDPSLGPLLRPALIAAWKDLPEQSQQHLILYRWPLIAGPEMLPVLRGLVAGPQAPNRTIPADAREAAIVHIYELDSAAGRALILSNLTNGHSQLRLKTVQLLSLEDIASVLPSAVERISKNNASEIDFQLLDHYADASALAVAQTVFESAIGKWACAQQASMLRYFLRVAPEYGAREVQASLGARKHTGCYHFLPQSLGDQLPAAQQSVIEAMDDADPELVQDAVLALGKWGSPDAEATLWAKMQRFHDDWMGREDQLRPEPDYSSPGSRAAGLEQGLVSAIAKGHNWLCPPEKLLRLDKLVLTPEEHKQIEGMINTWSQGPALVSSSWFPEEKPTFSLLQYGFLTEEQLNVKLAQFPRGTRFLWLMWQPGRISPPVALEKQEAVYERVRAAAEQHGVVLEIKKENPSQ